MLPAKMKGGRGDFRCVASVSVVSALAFGFSYLPGMATISGMTGTAGLGRSVAYEPARDLITTVSNHVNHVNPVLISAYDYANDSAGRRVSRNADSFGYNARSEVIGAVIGTNNYGYAYDAIGNRVWSAVNTLTNSYTANCLNQYTAVTPPIAVAYDADGNMTYYGDWYHTWDAENRLTSSQPAGFATNGAVRLEYVYNHKNLRVAKIKKQLSGRGADYPFNPLQPGTWDAIETRRYVWDGYNIAAEIVIDEVTPSTNITYYVWGTDLSGTLQGAGGVGGLLAVVRNGTPYFPCYDANGNVTAYVDAAGNIRAHYEYSPFGEITAQSGDLADTFTFRFSTKYWDAETRSYYYGYRHYAPKLGCWLNRDPMEEKGGLNLSIFVNNDSANKWDYLGLAEWEAVLTIQDVEAHSFGCPEWAEFSGQGDADSYFGHFKTYTLGKWLAPKIVNVPIKLPSSVVNDLASQMINGLGMTRGDKKILWAVTLGTKFAYSKKYKKDNDCVRDVEFRGFAMRIEKMTKGDTKIVVVYSGGYAKPKKITASATVKVQ
jgi:RHS repeat-associated protein